MPMKQVGITTSGTLLIEATATEVEI